VLEQFAPDWLQTDAGDFAGVELPSGCRALPVYRDGALPDAPPPPRLLFEAAQSGSGLRADWNVARELAAQTELVLAGGLDAANVADAILKVRPWGVDVSSGVERRRGEKDPAKIEEFVARVRALLE
jgi:phosphoribosylanthranilate isomerase